MQQLGLDFIAQPRAAPPPRARAQGPLTSQLAAARVDEFAKEHHSKVLQALAQGTGTIYEIGARAGIDHVAVARRMKELQADGLVRLVEGETRNSPKGRPCRVWELAP